jgi:diguanylate cyclase (GGDEF)-like protein
VLRKVAEIVRRSVRASDVCVRYGGDEFAVIIPDHGAGGRGEDAGAARYTAERIRSRVEAFRWEGLGLPANLAVTVSIGVAMAEPGEAADSLIGRADQRLYAAKTSGRNRVFPTTTI